MCVCCECCVSSGRGLCEGPITRPGQSYRLWCGNSPLTPTMTRQTQVRTRNWLSVQFFRRFLTSVQQSASLCEVLLVMSAAPTFPISLASHDAVRRRRLETCDWQSQAIKHRSHFHRKSCRNQSKSGRSNNNCIVLAQKEKVWTRTAGLRIWTLSPRHDISSAKPEGKRQLGRPGSSSENNIKMHLQQIGWRLDWIDLAQDREKWQASRGECSNETYGSIKRGEFLD